MDHFLGRVRATDKWPVKTPDVCPVIWSNVLKLPCTFYSVCSAVKCDWNENSFIISSLFTKDITEVSHLSYDDGDLK